MIKAEFSSTSQPASAAIAIKNCQLRLSLQKSSPASQKKSTPCSTCVKLYGSNKCCDVWVLFQAWCTYRATSPDLHHQILPCPLRAKIMRTVTPAAASHGQIDLTGSVFSRASAIQRNDCLNIQPHFQPGKSADAGELRLCPFCVFAGNCFSRSVTPRAWRRTDGSTP